MELNRFDRQNRVFGIEGTQTLQNSCVRIKGPMCDLTYEVAKNLALSGVGKLKLCLDIDMEIIHIDHFKPGKVHLGSMEIFVNEISKLNPYLEIESVDPITFYQESTDVIIFVSPVDTDREFMSNSNSNKIISFWATDNIQSDIVNFSLFNDFKYHLVTDIDGENYELITLGEIQKKSDTLYELKTSANHNLFDTNIITIKLDHLSDPFIVKVKNVVNTHTIEIESDEEIDLNSKFESYTNGYICRVKENIYLNHQLFNELEHCGVQNQLEIDSLSPLVQYYFGAIISSEAIKAITSKYIPFNQTGEFEFSHELAFGPIQGSELDIKLRNLKCFIVGSGAIGCELLKNLVSVNASVLPDSYIRITDPDHIEVSNLSRQFLFRSENIGKSKSEIASNRIKTFEPNTNMIPYQEKLSDSNQKFVNENFSDVDVIFNALDNMESRLYVDSQAVKFCKPLFESGTLGTKGNTQPVIPHITESYGASRDQPQEQSFAACTLKNFPSLIQHTIHWAMDDFDGLFNKQPIMLKQYIGAFENGMKYDYLDSLDSIETNLIKNNVYRLIRKLDTVTELSDYVKWAYQLWVDRFVSRINKLLNAHPFDSEIDGRLFWSNGKKCPTAKLFDFNSKSNTSYIKATTRLLIATYNVFENDLYISDNDIIQCLERVLSDKIDPYSDDPDVFEDIQTYPHLTDLEKLISICYKLTIHEQHFEKDDDTNNHILYVQSASNSRALNYSIPIASFYETKGIAGRIVPALATTTSIVASLITIEMLKYLNNPLRPIESYRSSFINLAQNFMVDTEPVPTIVTDTNGLKFTEWGPLPNSGEEDKLESSRDIKLSSFIETWSNRFKCPITMVLVGSKILYMQGINESNLDKDISSMVNQENTYLSMCTEDENIVLPEIKLV